MVHTQWQSHNSKRWCNMQKTRLRGISHWFQIALQALSSRCCRPCGQGSDTGSPWAVHLHLSRLHRRQQSCSFSNCFNRALKAHPESLLPPLWARQRHWLAGSSSPSPTTSCIHTTRAAQDEILISPEESHAHEKHRMLKIPRPVLETAPTGSDMCTFRILGLQTTACMLLNFLGDLVLHYMLLPPNLIQMGLMAVCCRPIVAALCATGVFVYADCDRLVVTVRWQHGCHRPPGPAPPGAS